MPSPVILNHLGPAIGECVATHWSRPRVVTGTAGTPPWQVPDGVEVLLTGPVKAGWERAPAAPPEGWPFGLRWIQSGSAGVDPYPPWMLRGATVTCARGVTAVPIAEYVLTALLAHEKRFDAIRVRGRTDWRQEELGTLAGRTLGLVGFGAIGRAIARRALAFDMRVGAVRRSAWSAPEPGVEAFASLDALVAEADHLVLALPLTAKSRRIVDAALLERVRPGLHLVNVARGALVDQHALLAALEDGRLSGATLDVTDPEPLPAGHPLYRHPKVRLTPHVSWSDPGMEARLADTILANLDAYARGQPLRDVVDPAAGY